MLKLHSSKLSLVVASGLLLSAAACAPETDADAAAPAAQSSNAVNAHALALSAAGSSGSADSPATVDPWAYFRGLQRLSWWRWHHRWHPPQNSGGSGGHSDDQDAGTPITDDTNTPGDDRPGFVACPGGDDPALVCKPEQRCCRSPEITCDSVEQDCRRPDVTVSWADNCDGPEDCENGWTCVRGKYGASCTPANPQQGYPVLCHSDRDCAFIPESQCHSDGVCMKL